MLIRCFLMLRAAGVPVSITEFLALLETLASRLISPEKGTLPFSGVEDFYWVSRSVPATDERHYDRFDREFAAHFRGVEQAVAALLAPEIPAGWLRRSFELQLSDEEKARIEALAAGTR